MNEVAQPALESEVVDFSLGIPVEEGSTPEAPAIGAADEITHNGVVSATFAKINAEPKVRIRIPKVNGPQTVVINGARWDIPANMVVDVPRTVAEILRESERI